MMILRGMVSSITDDSYTCNFRSGCKQHIPQSIGLWFDPQCTDELHRLCCFNLVRVHCNM